MCTFSSGGFDDDERVIVEGWFECRLTVDFGCLRGVGWRRVWFEIHQRARFAIPTMDALPTLAGALVYIEGRESGPCLCFDLHGLCRRPNHGSSFVV